MTIQWQTPPWQRHTDCTYMAVTLTDAGDQISMAASAVRGDTATEALADLLMGPGSAAIRRRRMECHRGRAARRGGDLVLC